MSVTIGQILDYVAPGYWTAGIPAWPPDAFAIVAFLLHQSGAYTRAIESDWPAAERSEREAWYRWVRKLGAEWFADEVGGSTAFHLRRWWQVIVDAHAVPLHQIGDDAGVVNALLSIMAVADEACVGAGTLSLSHPLGTDGRLLGAGETAPPASSGRRTIAARLVRSMIDRLIACSETPPRRATLCTDSISLNISVLPRFHTPQTGLTLRSMSHHLSLVVPREVACRWYVATGAHEEHSLNLLVLPWPLEIRPSQFVPEPNHRHGDHSARFTYHPRWTNEDQIRFIRVVRAAMDLGRIDGVVFPELALPPDGLRFVKRFIEQLADENAPWFLIAGIGVAPDGRHAEGGNFAAVWLGSRFDAGSLARSFERADAAAPRGGVWSEDDLHTRLRDRPAEPTFLQHKHHRWRLDRKQLTQYQLGGRLDVMTSWWEQIGIRERTVHFFSMGSRVAMSVLICEDLARQDPVSDILRSVGPTLIVALLMDGPQIPDRWPARYATVLADDPGSSVLTVSSVGMVQQCRPVGKPPSRAFAMWKDADSGLVVPIELPPGADGVLLALSRIETTERTADGRPDRGSTSTLTLTGVHPIGGDRP